jgi:hypothetical protein
MRNFIIVLVIGLVIGLLIGGFAGYHLRQCPQVVSTKTDTVVTYIHVKDTVNTMISKDSIKVVWKVVPKHDTIKIVDTKPVMDTTICYEFEQVQKDSAFTKVQLCSDSLPKQKPLDLQAIFTYVPPPYKEKVVTNTVTIIKPTPYFKDWKTYALMTLAAAAAGYVVAKH